MPGASAIPNKGIRMRNIKEQAARLAMRTEGTFSLFVIGVVMALAGLFDRPKIEPMENLSPQDVTITTR